MGSDRGTELAVIETHPVQYHAPVYRCLEQRYGIRTTAIYGSNFSVAGSLDREFGRRIAWDSDLLSGYMSMFLSRVEEGGAAGPGKLPGRSIASALRSAKPKAVLLPGYSPGLYRWAFLSALRAGTPIVFRGETTDHARKRGPAKAWLRDRLLRSFYKRCGALLYIGVRSREHFRRFVDDAVRLFHSPYCVDLASACPDEYSRRRLRPALREQLRLGEDQIALLFSGKLSPRKGPDVLLTALSQLPPDLRRRIVIVFMGDGEMAASLRQLAEEQRVETRFAGFQNQTQLSPYYHAADLLVLPSRHSETWGLVVNEALHHGLPCVVSDAVGCLPDLIEDGVTGESAAAGCSSSLAAAIRRAIPLSGRLEIRELCRERVQSYSVENAAQGIARAYRFVVASQ
jgi:glycosyltransferase involved in cell wall biosynthesis